MKVNYKRLTDDAKAPKVATAGSAGADISSASIPGSSWRSPPGTSG